MYFVANESITSQIEEGGNVFCYLLDIVIRDIPVVVNILDTCSLKDKVIIYMFGGCNTEKINTVLIAMWFVDVHYCTKKGTLYGTL